MKRPDFAAGYNPEIAWHPMVPAAIAEATSKAEDFAMGFGRTLHSYLSGTLEDNPSLDFDTVTANYLTWVGSGSVTAWAKQMKQLPPEQHDTAHVYAGFHQLNIPMFDTWQLPSGEDHEVSNRERLNTIVFSIEMLALSSLQLLTHRSRHVGFMHDFDYFSPELEADRAGIEGSLAEIDSAITLLEAAKTQPFDILPAPPQFERGEVTSRNCDFVAIGREALADYAHGIQVKSRVTEEDIEKYDPDFVTLVCSATDLGNTRAQQTKARSSNKNLVAWNGQVACEVIGQRLGMRSGIKKGGAPRPTHFIDKLDKNSRNLIRTQLMHVRTKERDTRPVLSNAAKLLGERVVHDLVKIPATAPLEA